MTTTVTPATPQARRKAALALARQARDAAAAANFYLRRDLLVDTGGTRARRHDEKPRELQVAEWSHVAVCLGRAIEQLHEARILALLAGHAAAQAEAAGR